MGWMEWCAGDQRGKKSAWEETGYSHPGVWLWECYPLTDGGTPALQGRGHYCIQTGRIPLGADWDMLKSVEQQKEAVQF